MEYESYLLTMAQIAGVLVGFATIANAISRPGMSPSELQLNKLRIIVTTENGILIIVWCMLPALLSKRMGDNDLFQLMSIIGFLCSVSYMIFVSVRIRKFTGVYYPKLATKVIQVVSVLFITIPFGLNALGVFGIGNTGFVFCLVIFYLFCMVCILFVRLLYSVLPDVLAGE